MFNRKKREIERLKNNIAKLNENRMELSGENIRLQKELANLNEKFDLLNNKYDMINNAILGFYEKFEPKKIKKVKIKSSSFDLEKDGTINVKDSTPKKKGTKKNEDINKWYEEKFKVMLAKAGYNQTTLAKEMGISSSTISGLTKESRNVGYETKKKVKEFLTKKVEENETK